MIKIVLFFSSTFLLFHFINLNLLSPRKFIWLCYCVTAARKADYFTFLLSALRHLVAITLEFFQLEWVLSVCLLQARKAAILMLFGGRAFSWLIHIAATLTILCVVLILAIFVPDIRNVFGVVGMWYFENTFNIWGGGCISIDIILFINYRYIFISLPVTF